MNEGPAAEVPEEVGQEELEYIDMTVKDVTEYDAESHLIRRVKYDLNGNLLSESNYAIEYEYDSRGDVAEAVFYNDSGRPNEKIKYEYDTEGKLKKEIVFFNRQDGEVIGNWTEYLYDENGGWTQDCFLNQEGGFDNGGTVRWLTKYDTAGNETGYFRYDIDGNILESRTCQYEYDAQGNIISERKYQMNGQEEWETEVEYGLLEAIETPVYFEKETTVLGLEPGNLMELTTKESNYNNGELIFSYQLELSYEYDQDGNLIKAMVVDVSDDEYSYYLGDIVEVEYEKEKISKVKYYDGFRWYCQEYEYSPLP